MNLDRAQSAADLYLRLLKRCLTRTLFPDSTHDWTLTSTQPADLDARAHGGDWPTEALTMVGLVRLDNVQECIRRVIADGVPGDVMETGIWRGGCGIFMRAALEAYGDRDRRVWLADSFEGLPPPSPAEYPADEGDPHATLKPYLGVSLETVKQNFELFEMLDERVHFLTGWFRDTLPAAPVERIAVLRLDGDMYESTIVALSSLYPRVSAGGFIIIDDYGALPGCRLAVDDYRASKGITDELTMVDWTGAFWRKGT